MSCSISGHPLSSVQVSTRVCEAVCGAVLARVPYGGLLLGGDGGGADPAQPSLAVRAMRRGLRVAYGAAGAVNGVGAGVLRTTGVPLSLPWRQASD